MRRFYLVLSVLIILLGLVHVAATFGIFDGLSSRAVWFASGGIAIILTGVLNLLNRAYGTRARGVRWAAVGANLVMAVFAGLAGIAGAASGAQLVGIVGLLAVTAFVSFRHPGAVSSRT